MRTTGIFQTAHREITLKSVKDPLYIIPFGDVHLGAPGFSQSHWREFIKEAKAKHKRAYFIGMGDYWDFASSSERTALRTASLHDATRDLFETLARKQITEFKRSINWMGDHLLGLVGGNHTWKFEDGQTADEKLAMLMGVPFLGVCAVLRLFFDYQSRRTSMDIFVHHGKGGGGKTEGNSINQVADMMTIMPGADLYIMGHDHDMWTKPAKPRLHPVWNNKKKKLEIKEKRQYLVRSGSFLKAYEPGASSYIVDKPAAPCHLGAPQIEVRLRARDTRFVIEMKGVA